MFQNCENTVLILFKNLFLITSSFMSRSSHNRLEPGTQILFLRSSGFFFFIKHPANCPNSLNDYCSRTHTNCPIGCPSSTEINELTVKYLVPNTLGMKKIWGETTERGIK